MAIFLEFFVLENNHTLQDPLYTRSITLILCIERNKKIRFQTNSTCKFASWTWQGKLKQSKFSANRLELARNTKRSIPTFSLSPSNSEMTFLFCPDPRIFFHFNEIVICKLYHELHRGIKIILGSGQKRKVISESLGHKENVGVLRCFRSWH